MAAYKTFYKIAEIVIKIESPFLFYSYNAEDFCCEPSEPDYIFRFEQTNDIPRIIQDAEMVADIMWAHEYRRKDQQYLRAFLWREQYYAAVSVLQENEGVCYYASADILVEKAKQGFELLMYLCLERILLRFGCLVLHSSHIKIGGRGLVFSAASQIGKSTQAELWRKYANAQIINGDRSVLRKMDGSWFVYGCPMCGTSDIHLQSKEPLRHIIMLAQGMHNQLKRIGGAEAFRLIYPQITVSTWDYGNTIMVTKMVEEIISEIPIWRYSCTKDPDAVYVLGNRLEIWEEMISE